MADFFFNIFFPAQIARCLSILFGSVPAIVQLWLAFASLPKSEDGSAVDVSPTFFGLRPTLGVSLHVCNSK